MAPHAAFILDDTTDRRVGRRLENVSYVFDHVIGKTLLGFKHLVLGLFDGTTFIPLDFAIHAEKRLKGRKECAGDKITQAIAMIKRAVKHAVPTHDEIGKKGSWGGRSNNPHN